MQPHIHLEETLGISYAIMPGDPARVERAAQFLEDVKELGCNREYRCVSGTFRGVRMLLISTGMGGPSTAIAVEELQRIGIRCMVRIGSCGALRSGIAIGDLVLAQGAVRDEGTSNTYVPAGYPAVSDDRLLFLCQQAAQRLKFRTHTGIIRSHDSFYIDEQEEINTRWSRRGLLGSDMETAALLTVARLRGVRALSILNNVVLWGEDTFDSIGAYSTGAQDSETGERASILLAMETLADFDQREQNA